MILARWIRLIFKSLKEEVIHRQWQKQRLKRERKSKRSKKKLFEDHNYLLLLGKSTAKRNTNLKSDKSHNFQRKTMKIWLKSTKIWLRSSDQNLRPLRTVYSSQFKKTKSELKKKKRWKWNYWKLRNLTESTKMTEMRLKRSFKKCFKSVI